MSIFDHFQARYEAAKDEELSLQEFLALCKEDKSAYANAAERLLMAIGEPELIDTAKHPRLSRIFSNRVMYIYLRKYLVLGFRSFSVISLASPVYT